MIAEDQVERIRRLLQQGRLSQREIAKQVGVCRNVVAGIASGRRPDYADRQRQRVLADVWFDDQGPVARCPQCGGQVHMPCRLCGVRALKEQEAQLRREARRNAARIALRQFLAAMLRRQLSGMESGKPRERKAG